MEDKTIRDTSGRREAITRLLKEKGSVQVLPLAKQFSVSTQTIRKDLKFLETMGVATRSYGGAILVRRRNLDKETAIAKKQHLYLPQKSKIGEAAAAMIEAGDSVILDTGTTTLQIAAHMEDSEGVVVVTNDFGIMNELAWCDQIQLVMLGGSLRRKSMSLYGTQTDYAMKNLFVNKLFLGVDGFDFDKGVSTHFEPAASLNRSMVRSADQVILVMDSSKFGQVCLHKVMDIELVSILITDTGAPMETVKQLREQGVEVILVEPHDDI